MDFETTQWLKKQLMDFNEKFTALSTKLEFVNQKLDAIRPKLDNMATRTSIEQLQIGQDALTVKLDAKPNADQIASADDMHRVLDQLDHIAKLYSDHSEDHELADGQLADHKRWIDELAKQTGTTLSEA